jgi:hypothetical protein
VVQRKGLGSRVEPGIDGERFQSTKNNFKSCCQLQATILRVTRHFTGRRHDLLGAISTSFCGSRLMRVLRRSHNSNGRTGFHAVALDPGDVTLDNVGIFGSLGRVAVV